VSRSFGRCRRIALASLVLIAACSRGLTPAETEVARALFGASLDPGAVRVLAGVGLAPLPQPDEAALPASPRQPPENPCLRQQSPRRVLAWPAAFTLGNRIYFNPRYYAPDAARGYPRSLPLPAALLLMHELVHVWQWQNRAQTGYSAGRAAGESVARVDPYWWLTEEGRAFFRFGFEQQAAIIEDFACYAFFDRRDPKLAELAALLRPVLPVDRFLAGLAAAR
jgi:hypothetical protein